jgi:hypothetical protein
MLLITAVALLSSQARAQNPLVAASGSTESPNLKVDWSLGDVFAEVFSNDKVSVATGVSAAASVFVITGDVDRKEVQSPSVYPVPFENEFYIDRKEDAGYFEFKVFDTSGKEIPLSFSEEGLIYRVDAAALAAGAYVLVIKQMNSTTPHVFKLIKK